MNNQDEHIGDGWLPISELREVEDNISSYGYSKEYIEEYGLHEKLQPHATNLITGQVNFFEPLEVAVFDGQFFYRENRQHRRKLTPEFFNTQFGTFNNHDNGEFLSWLGRKGYTGFPELVREIHHVFGRDDFFLEGNFCEMLDCGDFSYAISNLLHLGLGDFKIYRIDKDLGSSIMYNTSADNGWTHLEYDGCFQNQHGWIVIASGYTKSTRELTEERTVRDRTLLFQIDYSGNCFISKEWESRIPSPNSFVVSGDIAYFGHNRMLSRLNLSNGDLAFYTNKGPTDLDALCPMF